MCLASNGVIFFGDGPYVMQPGIELSTSLEYTPLFINPISTAAAYVLGDTSVEYFIGVKSIKINEKQVPVKKNLLSINSTDGYGGTKISTVNPYTVMETSIYSSFVDVFTKEAEARNISRVAPVAPFGTCFSRTNVGSTRVGAAVPTIDLVLQNEKVIWRVFGANSMVHGKALRTGVEYYILPVIRGRGGGLALEKKLNGSQCPLEAVQEQAEVSNGLPVTFTSVDPKAKLVRISTDLNVKFSAMSICVQSMVWRLAEFDEPTQKTFIEMSGVEGNPGPATSANWFKIDKDGDSKDYKLVFCPSVCNFCRFACRNVGIYIGGDGVRRLALVDSDAQPFKIMFKKVSSTC
ncbi:hypothetical protein MKW92_003913 [Papaver armeniacum]|nr:hypothetical protein MKW92_003913 [Papaver armeniacum]